MLNSNTNENTTNQVSLFEMVNMVKEETALTLLQEQQRTITMNRPDHFQDVLFEKIY